jgi:signal transduction histidine kinase
MALIGFIIAVWLFMRYRRYLLRSRRYWLNQCGSAQAPPCRPPGIASWHEQWHRHWADKFDKQADRRIRHVERHAQRRLRNLDRRARRLGVFDSGRAGSTETEAERKQREEAELLRRARRRAAAEVGFYSHLMSYLGVIAFLALINVFTTRYPWFIWPAMGWGIALFAHYMAVFGRHMLRERYFEPAVEREVRREKVAMQSEKQASIDELSATIAHEIRNPIAAAKSLVQQMGEDPTSLENVEYAKVALGELDRVERRVSHLLKYAKEEDYTFDQVNLATIVDSALTQMRAKLDAAKVSVARNYITGPTLMADQDKLRQVFANILDNAIDALASVAEGRRIDLFIDNGGRGATVRIRDNGCGVPADKIDRIFNPFFTTKEHGTGLGMAISKKIVEAHEGKIDVVSEQGKSTELIITLPIPQ